ncbi:hypothetical protein B0T22DRAFT_369675 [Podospora appendiculata]|uniref:Short chain dehydrogenase n=1 Tax=Podospora appendiculata TaxID=314037 RepID=A0AAE0XET5_9PEZI|nr:hypothetical protein B0T22DRAFT_369675 [Podospora appendiculata]
MATAHPTTNKKVALVVGASRGIGRQVAIDLAANGYAVVVASKSYDKAPFAGRFPPDPNSNQSTINTVEREIREAGGEATALRVDTSDPVSVEQVVAQTVQKYGRLDAVIYNAGAIWWAPVKDTPLKRFMLMQRVNAEGLYGIVQAALPHLKTRDRAASPPKQGGRIVVVSPPIYSRFFRGKTAYAMGKVAMSVLTKGLAMDFEREGLADEMAITSIWPAAAIESAATDQFTRKDPKMANDLRKPTIFSDAILAMLGAPARAVNGQLELDEDFLRRHAGVDDFSKYSVVPGTTPRRIMPAVLPDLTVREQDDEGQRINLADEVKGKL